MQHDTDTLLKRLLEAVIQLSRNARHIKANGKRMLREVGVLEWIY